MVQNVRFSSPLFQSSSSSLGMGTTPGQNNSIFGQNPTFSDTSNTTSSFWTGGFLKSTFATSGQPGFGQTTPSLTPPFQESLPSQTPFNFNNAGQTQAGGASSTFGQTLGQPGSANQSPAVLQPVSIANPFGTLPPKTHISIGNTGMSPSIQYGISSRLVPDKTIPARISSLLTTQHLSQRRPARKYHPKNDGSRVAFFSDEDEQPSTPKSDALVIPKENPRPLIIRPVDQGPKPLKKEAFLVEYENGKLSVENQHHRNGSVAEGNNGTPNGNRSLKDRTRSVIFSSEPTYSVDPPNQELDSLDSLSWQAEVRSTIRGTYGADILAIMPKLRHSEYYTKPEIWDLAAKERAKPGYCKHIRDFIVGRYCHGSIRFLGETDVRGLELECLIQFKNREVIIYRNVRNKPHKPVEVTLLNIKVYDKQRNQIIEGPEHERYKDMLKEKTEDQGAVFISYDPLKGEWKFRVDHFSKYVFSRC